MIPLPIIGEIIAGVSKVADDLITSDEERSKMELDQYNAETQRMEGQVEINKLEAASANRWDSGWRPAIGWVCALILALAYIPKVLAITALWCFAAYQQVHTGTLPPFPELGITEVMGLLFSLLGIGAMRSFDKAKGTSK